MPRHQVQRPEVSRMLGRLNTYNRSALRNVDNTSFSPRSSVHTMISNDINLKRLNTKTRITHHHQFFLRTQRTPLYQGHRENSHLTPPQNRTHIVSGGR